MFLKLFYKIGGILIIKYEPVNSKMPSNYFFGGILAFEGQFRAE